MRICILTTVHTPFDTRIFHKEAKSLAKVHEVVLIAPDEERTDKELDGVRIITIKKPKSKLLHQVTMWRVFKAGFKQDCDVYHCHEPDSLMIGVLLKILKGKRIIYDIHEHWPSEISYGWLKIKNKILDKVVQLISLRIELFLSKGLPGNKVANFFILVMEGRIKNMPSLHPKWNYPKLPGSLLHMNEVEISISYF